MAIPTDTQRAQTRISQIQAAKEPAVGKRKKKRLQTNGDEVHDTEPLGQLRVAIWLRLPHCLPPPQRLRHHGANNDSVPTTTNTLQQKRPEAAAAAAAATAVVGNFEIPSQSSKFPTTNSSAIDTKPLPLSPATIYNKTNKQTNKH
jgi:hypothetical protein